MEEDIFSFKIIFPLVLHLLENQYNIIKTELQSKHLYNSHSHAHPTAQGTKIPS